MKKSKLPEHLPTNIFIIKFASNLALGFTFILISLFIGMWGYHHYEGMSWLDAYLNASMILSGMGPVAILYTQGGKFFAGTYAIFSGVLFLVTVGLVFAPLIHRLIHYFHVHDDD